MPSSSTHSPSDGNHVPDAPAPAAPDEPVVRTSSRSGLRDSVLGTRNLMTVAALAVVGSLVVVPLSYLTLVVAVSPRGILVMCALMGVWMVPYLLPGVIVNRPGSFLVAGLIMGVIGVFTTPSGASAIVGNLIGAAMAGAPTALTLYRRWTWWTYCLGGVVFGGANAWMYSTAYRVALTPAQTTAGVVISILSCFAAVGVCLLIRRALARTGVGVGR